MGTLNGMAAVRCPQWEHMPNILLPDNWPPGLLQRPAPINHLYPVDLLLCIPRSPGQLTIVPEKPQRRWCCARRHPAGCAVPVAG